ncbi:hypothetical protein [uncultured Pseudacidovorax sp.]|uniref:hypothetical protein n=1 Tax=uncultured Pseudacidovorax sp. TaxID=679313 RepID=UPI0025EB7B86|nr:hypothetical protein [uncultured Pseudacidovorax sp.]
MKRASLWLVVAMLAAVAAVWAVFWRSPGGGGGAEGQEHGPAAAVSAPSPATPAAPAAPAAAARAPAPWEQAPVTDGAAGRAALGAQAADPDAAARAERLRALEQVSAKLQSMRSSGRMDAAEVDKAIADLERISGSSTIGGIDLGVLRANLRAATRMQQLQKEIEQLAPTPTNPGEVKEADKARLAEKYKEMQGLIAQLQAGATGRPAAPATAPGGKP